MSESGMQFAWSDQLLDFVPKGWSVRPLDSIMISIDAGRSPDLPDRPARTGEWGVLKVSAIRPEGLQEGENKVVTRLSLIDPSIEIKHGDLLLSRANTPTLVGLTCFVRQPRAGLMLSDKTLRLNIDPTLAVPRFISYLLQGSSSRRQIETCGTGSSGSMKNISQDEIRSINIPLPRIHEQFMLADILDKVDETIQSAERVVAKLEILRHGLVHDILSHALRIVDKVTRLGDVSLIAGGVTLGRRVSGSRVMELPYLRVANVQDGFIDTSDMKTIRILSTELDRYRVRAGDVLMTEGGDFDKLGRGAVWDGSIDPCLHQNHIFRVRCDTTILLPEYLAMYSASPPGKNHFVFLSKQTTNLASINSTQLKSFPVPIPVLSAQRRIVQVVRAHDEELLTRRQELDKLRLLKQGMMDDLLTGRVRLGASS